MSEINPKPREIWWVDWDWDQIGEEINKTRPAVVIGRYNEYNKNMRIVLPLTTWQDRFKGKIHLLKLSDKTNSLLPNISAVNTYQIKCYSTQRFRSKIAKMADENDFQNTLFFAKRWIS